MTSIFNSAHKRINNLSNHVINEVNEVKNQINEIYNLERRFEDYKIALNECKKELIMFINEKNCSPILLRTAWHDAGTYNSSSGKSWPGSGGANGSIRFQLELDHSANAGLKKAISYLKPFKEKYPIISWADLIQLAGACAVEVANGPIIPMRYGRVDVLSSEDCPSEGYLPNAEKPFDNINSDAASHLRNIFYRMGFCDQEIVALSGAHTIGRAFKNRSGLVENGYGDKEATSYTCPMHIARPDNKEGIGLSGGKSWTKNWLTFDNSYFKNINDKDLVRFESDLVLYNDSKFRPYFEMYANDNEIFLHDFSLAMAKLSECGAKFNPPQGFTL